MGERRSTAKGRPRNAIPWPSLSHPLIDPAPLSNNHPKLRPPQCLEILLSVCYETCRGVDGLPRPGSVGVVKSQPTPDETYSCCMPPYRAKEHSSLRPRRDESNTVVVVAHSHHPCRSIRPVRGIEPDPAAPRPGQSVIVWCVSPFCCLPRHNHWRTRIEVELPESLDYLWRRQPVCIGSGAV